MKSLSLFFAINAWAFALDAVWLSLAAGIILCRLAGGPVWLVASFAAAGVYPLIQAFKLHAQTRDKLAAYRTLLGRNRDEFRVDTFEVFMAAPCGRMIVRCVLRSLGCPERFRGLRERYGKAFITCEKTGLVIVRPESQIISDRRSDGKANP